MPVYEPRADWFLQAVASALDERACDIENVVFGIGGGSAVQCLVE
jgi:hypothetical protein